MKKRGYKIDQHECFLTGTLKCLVLTNPEGCSTLVRFSEEPIYFIYGVKGVTRDNIDEYVYRGDVKFDALLDDVIVDKLNENEIAFEFVDFKEVG